MAATMIPCVVLDTETTGFPNNGSGYCGRVIEVGAVVITEDSRIVSPVSFLVRQPRAHLSSYQAKRAMGVHGITVDEVLAGGHPPEQAGPRFRSWLERVQERFGARHIRAYNQTFDFWFLEQHPWSVFESAAWQPGEDVQQTCRAAMGGKGRGPKLSSAVSFAQERGHGLAWSSAAHRALEDARMAAELAICLAG